MPNQTDRKIGEKTPWWEWLVMVLAIAAIWPVMLGRSLTTSIWSHFVWWIVLGVFGVLMVWVLVRKIARLHRLRDELDKEKGGLPPGGLPPFAR